MRVALVVPGFSAHEGDWAIPALEEFVRRLSAEADVTVFTLRWPQAPRQYRVYRATVHAFGGGHHLGWRVVSLWTRALRTLIAEHRRIPFDVIHGFWADEPGWLAVWAARQLGRPSVVSLQGGELVAMPEIDYGLLRWPGRRAAVRWALAGATIVTAGSKYHAEQAQRFSPALQGKLRRLHTGVDTTRFSPGPPDGRPRVAVLNVGSLVPVKHQARLLGVLARLPGVSAELVGDGPERSRLTKLALDLGVADRVRLVGRIPHETMPRIYRRAAIYVQTSWHEGQSHAVAEAAASGLAVVGTPVGVLPEVGLVAESEPALVERISGLLADPARRTELGRHARAVAARTLSLDASIPAFLTLYERLASRGS